MFKKVINSIRDAKLTYKLFFIFVVLFYVLINSWFFSFTTTKDVSESYNLLTNHTLPSLMIANNLKDDLHTSLLAAYDYASTGNADSKKLYQKKIKDVTNSSIKLFEVSETQQDLEFTQNFIENQINTIRNSADKLIKDYDADPNSPQISADLNELSKLRNDFNIFLEDEITEKAQDQVTAASNNIEKRAERITIYLYIVITLVIIVIIILFFFISHNISKPVKLLTTAAREFGKGRLQEVKLNRKDELGLFAETFNKMTKDISKSHVALQKELNKTKELDHQKSEFLSIAAHQLRTPMAGIKWVLKMFLDEDLGKINNEQKHHLENGLQNSERMIHLINDLLDITKIEEQKFQYKIQKNDIVHLLNSIINSIKPNAEKKKIKINLFLQNDIPLISFDKEKMRIALSNLIDNAIKYSPVKQAVNVYLKIEGKFLNLTIEDHGYGIPENQFNQVFTKFFRGSNILKIETDLETIGTGLGLYLVKDIITKHDGQITFKSEEGNGTTFLLALPLGRV